MQKQIKMSLRTKLYIAFSVMIVMIVANGLSGYIGLNSIYSHLNNIFEKELPSIDYLIEADRDYHQMLIAERALLVTDAKAESFKGFMDDYTTNTDQVYQRFQKFEKLFKEPDNALIKKFYADFNAWKRSSEKIIALVKENTPEARKTAADMSFGETYNLFETARDSIDKLTEISLNNAQKESDNSKSAFSSTLYMFMALIFVGVAAAFIIGNRMAASIVSNLTSATDVLKTLSEGEGDLTAKLPVKSGDEIGLLALYFNDFIEKLHSIISTVRSNSESISSGNTQLSAASEELSLNFNEQTTQLATIASATEEMSTSAEEVGLSVKEVSGRADEANRSISDGKVMLQDGVNSMMAIKDGVADLNRTIDQLSNSSNEIGGILNVINDIADQTNLLALNAAIEAARAGDQGRGFAVVADEVRKLAERSQNAIKEIEGIITNLQNESAVASKNMGEASSKVEHGVVKINNVREMFEVVTNAVNLIAESSLQIETAVNEQNSAIYNINDNVQTLSNGLDQSNVAISEVTKTITDLQSQTEGLSDLVSRFKV
ncbi:MAG: methyl-accepting chemotaxis protein [Deferribacterales bacterium]